MKKINILFMSLLTASMGFMTSCSDGEKVTIAPDEAFVSPVLKAILPENAIFTENTNMNSQLGYVLWDAADYGYSAAVKYTIQIDTLGGDFSKPAELVSSNTTQAIITPKMLNNAAKNFRDESGLITFDVRLMTSINTTGSDPIPVQKTLYSNVQNVTFKAYIKKDATPMKTLYYLIGNSLTNWNNDPGNIGVALLPLFSEDNDLENKNYSFTAYFNGGKVPNTDNDKYGFKIVTTPGDWNNGVYGCPVGIAPSGNLDSSADNFFPATSGYYTFTTDMSMKTFTFESFTVPADAKKFTTVGIIGDATSGGWDTDSPLTKIEGQDHLWISPKVTLKVGGMKFRAENSWDKGGNWGTGVIPYGKATNDGGSSDIKIENAGDYFIAFNDLTEEYIIIPVDKTLNKE